MTLATTTGRTAVVITMAAAVLVACSSDPAPACLAVTYGPPGGGSSSSSSRSSTSTSTSRSSTSTTQTQRNTQVTRRRRAPTIRVQPQQIKPSTSTVQPPRSVPTSIPKYVPASPRTVKPYSRSPFYSYPTQQAPIWHGSFRQYPGLWRLVPALRVSGRIRR